MRFTGLTNKVKPHTPEDLEYILAVVFAEYRTDDLGFNVMFRLSGGAVNLEDLYFWMNSWGYTNERVNKKLKELYKRRYVNIEQVKTSKGKSIMITPTKKCDQLLMKFMSHSSKTADKNKK